MAKRRAAVEAALLVRVPVVGAAWRVDGTRDHSASCSVPDRFKIRHQTSPCTHIMRASALMLAAVP